MQIFENINPLRNWHRQMVREGKLIGFVPTMGCLHEGHLGLTVAVSIFVNPAQFAPNEDLDKYPRTLSDDLAKLSAINCVDTVFIPKVEDIYPTGIHLDVEKQLGTFVEKDIQQCVVIKNLIRDLHFPLELHVGPTVREEDGLAMSSRNRYLTPEMRKVATTLYQSLNMVKHAYEQNIRDRKNLLIPAYDHIENKSKYVKDQNLGFSVKLDYLSLADPVSLEELDEVGENGAILSGALYVGTT
ncbi:19035_t:CDS:2, partial [Racocetra fulgida]